MPERMNSPRESGRRESLDELVGSGMPRHRGRGRLRQWGRNLLKILIVLGVLAAIFYVLRLSWDRFVVFNNHFRLQNVHFETNGHMSPQDAERILGLTRQENVLFLDIEGLELKMKKRADIVRISIHRELPASLSIEVEERLPVAWLECAPTELYAHNEESGLMVDSSGFIFPYDRELHKRYRECPVLKVSTPMDGRYDAGDSLEGVANRQALRFLKTAGQFVPEGIPLIRSVSFANEWSLTARFLDGMEITFGLYEHERQLHDLSLIMQHAYATNRRVVSANMLPSRNTPVVFAKGRKKEEVVEAVIVDDEEGVPLKETNESAARSAEEKKAVVEAAPSIAPVAKEKTTAARRETPHKPEEPSQASPKAKEDKPVSAPSSPKRAAKTVKETDKTSSSETKPVAPARKKTTKSAAAPKTSTAKTTSSKTSASGKKAKTSSSGTSGNKQTSSSKPAPSAPRQEPRPKQVEVPRFNW